MFVWIGRLYKRSKFQLNRISNRRVIRGQNIRHYIPTCLFEPNLTFTDRDETDARRKVWTRDSLGPIDQKFLSPHFRVMAPGSWYLPMFIAWIEFSGNLRFMYYGTITMLGISFSPIAQGHLLCLLISLFSRRDLQTHFKSWYLCLYCMQRYTIWHRNEPL